MQFVENFNEIVWNILPTPRKAAILKRLNLVLLGSSLIFYFVAIDDWRSNNRAETYTRLGAGAPASNKLSFMHLNIRSIVNKFDSFKQLINSFNTPFQVICLTETWLNDNNDDLFELENYDFVK